MNRLEKLVGKPLARADTGRSESVILARLLATEVRLYNQGALDSIRDRGGLPSRVAKDLTRAYRRYAEEAGRSGSAKRLFIAEAARCLAVFDERAIASILELEDARPEPVRVS